MAENLNKICFIIRFYVTIRLPVLVDELEVAPKLSFIPLDVVDAAPEGVCCAVLPKLNPVWGCGAVVASPSCG